MPVMTVRDIADALGVTTRTVYRRVAKGDRVVLDMLQGVDVPQNGHLEASEDVVAILREQLTEKDRQIAELHRLLVQSQQLALQRPGRPGILRRWWSKLV